MQITPTTANSTARVRSTFHNDWDVVAAIAPAAIKSAGRKY